MTITAHIITRPEQEKRADSKTETDLTDFVGKFRIMLERLTEDFVQTAITFLQPLLQSPSGLAFCHFEQALFVQGVELSAKSAGSFLTILHESSPWPAMVCADARRKEPSLVHKGMRSTPVRLLDGSLLQLKTPYLLQPQPKRSGPKRKVGQRGSAGAGCYPVLQALGIQAQATPALLSEVAQTSMRAASFEEARQVLHARGCQLCKKTVERLALVVGEAATDQQDARIGAADEGIHYSEEFVDKRLMIGVDGGRARIRIYNKGRKRKSGHRGFEGKWKEPKLFVVYILDEKGKPVKDALPLYDATMGDADFAFDLLVAELKLRGAGEAKEIIVTSDGAKWIWSRTQKLAEQLGLSEDKITRVLDFYHVCERLTAVMDCCKNYDAAEKKEWYNKQRKRLLAGKIPEVLRAIRLLARGKRKKTVGEHLRYLEKKKEHMDYKKYRDLGIPRGSGATESAIRRVINLRLKGAGYFWLIENLDKMLHLRAALKSGRWDELFARVAHRHPNGEAPQLPAIPVDLDQRRSP